MFERCRACDVRSGTMYCRSCYIENRRVADDEVERLRAEIKGLQTRIAELGEYARDLPGGPGRAVTVGNLLDTVFTMRHEITRDRIVLHHSGYHPTALAQFHLLVESLVRQKKEEE